MPSPAPTGREVDYDSMEVLVSKTDARGVITYANEIFVKVCKYPEDELLGRPHSIVRHPDMPRCVFKLLWDTIMQGEEIFAYVKNLCADGDHYWVFAHVTPDVDPVTGEIVGYHSSRRRPRPEAVAAIEPLYAQLLEIEGGDKRSGMQRGTQALLKILGEAGVTYEQFVFSI